MYLKVLINLIALVLSFSVNAYVPLNTPYRTPFPIVGQCNASCTPNDAFPCIYTPFYPVTFTKDGYWFWDAPFENGSGSEVGVGLILYDPSTDYHINGTWEAKWYGGNRIESDPKKTTHCACYYLIGKGPKDKWVIHNYPVKDVEDAVDKSIEDICGHFSECPRTEIEAEKIYGGPWIETYYEWCTKI